MRFIIHELPYETPVAAGLFRYERDGQQPTGLQEHWRLTTAVDGYRFLRVDVDGQGTAAGESALYHLTINPAGRPERLQFLYWNAAGDGVSGNVLFEETVIAVTRDMNGERIEEEVAVAAGYGFWLPSAAGLGLLVEGEQRMGGMERIDTEGELKRMVVTLDGARGFGLVAAEVRLSGSVAETVWVMGKAVTAERVTLFWGERPYTLWLDEHRWPLKVEEGGGTAVESRYIRYG
jgi:hypothetical protein